MYLVLDLNVVNVFCLFLFVSFSLILSRDSSSIFDSFNSLVLLFVMLLFTHQDMGGQEFSRFVWNMHERLLCIRSFLCFFWFCLLWFCFLAFVRSCFSFMLSCFTLWFFHSLSLSLCLSPSLCPIQSDISFSVSCRISAIQNRYCTYFFLIIPFRNNIINL